MAEQNGNLAGTKALWGPTCASHLTGILRRRGIPSLRQTDPFSQASGCAPHHLSVLVTALLVKLFGILVQRFQ